MSPGCMKAKTKRPLRLTVAVFIPFLSTGAARINNNLRLLVAALNDPLCLLVDFGGLLDA